MLSTSTGTSGTASRSEAALAFKLMYASEMDRGSLLTGAREEVARGTVEELDQMESAGTRATVRLATASLVVSVARATKSK